MNLCEAQWLAYVLPYRRFAAALTGDRARLGADVDRYSVIASDLHRLLVAGLPAHCERFCTLSTIRSWEMNAKPNSYLDVAVPQPETIRAWSWRPQNRRPTANLRREKE
jgi:hypothetical protein